MRGHEHSASFLPGGLLLAALLPAILLFTLLCTACVPRAQPVRTGLEVLRSSGFAPLRGKRVGVITNPTGVDRSLTPLPELISAADGVVLAAIFGPEHGAAGASPAGDPVAGGTDPATGVPVHSLYGAVRRPTPDMLSGIDVLLFDIQDVGARPYTYLSTLKEALAAAAESRIELWVLDRPLPAGADIVEGPVLEPGRESFVGAHAIALRHGLTAGEFARMVNEEDGPGAALRVIPMEGYRRDLPFGESGLIWIPPSPNIPTIDSAFAYAGMVLIEGTNLSEGRGTTRPFQLIGAPWLDGRALAARLSARRLPGCAFRPAVFQPTSSKHEGKECGGVELHITDRTAFRSVTAAVALLLSVREIHPGRLEIRKDAFDRLAGTASLREAIERGAFLEEIIDGWRPALEEYLRRRQRHLLY